ncbi:hypothetical protein ACOSQ2_030961 [Xanthoceras sorbifolium]
MWSPGRRDFGLSIQLVNSFISGGSSPQPPLEKWRAPSLAWFQLNCDTALDVSNKIVGFGAVIRDDKGLVMAASAHNYNSLVSVEVAEAMALLHEVHLAAEMGISPIGFECDSSSIVSAINSRITPCSDVGLVLSDIYLSFESIPVILVSFIHCKCNAVVHCLVKFSLFVVEHLFWLEESPPCV